MMTPRPHVPGEVRVSENWDIAVLTGVSVGHGVGEGERGNKEGQRERAAETRVYNLLTRYRTQR